jgi:hypothetical protein
MPANLNRSHEGGIERGDFLLKVKREAFVLELIAIDGWNSRQEILPWRWQGGQHPEP